MVQTQTEGLGGLQKITLRSPGGSTAEVYEYGAHVTSWKVNGKELLFLSKEAIFRAPKAIRGGIPVCWPQFRCGDTILSDADQMHSIRGHRDGEPDGHRVLHHSDFGPLQSHGFARNSNFELRTSSPDSATLVLTDEFAPDTFPHKFELLVTVTLRDRELQQEVRVVNAGGEDFEFTAALHSYFRVGDIGQAHVSDLSNQPYLDNLDGRNRKALPPGPLGFDREVDRIFVGAPANISIVNGARRHRVTVRRSAGFPDAVVWNPWVDKAKSTADFGDEEYREMLCVEAAVAPSGPVVVRPGADAAWTASQTLVYEPAADA